MKSPGAWIAGVALMAACSTQPPPRPDNREAAYRENNRGVAELEQYTYDKAVASFRRAMALDDRVALPYLNLAIAAYYAGAFDEAQQAIESARPKFPDSPHVAFIEGLLARAANQPADAESAFKRVLALDADDGASMVNLGQIYLQDRRVEEAIAVLRAAVGREPSNATARYVLGQALIRSGAREEGARETARFEALRDSGAGVTYTQTYLEQGHYAEALVSTGLEADLIDRAAPRVRFSAWVGPGPIAVSTTPQASNQAESPDKPAGSARNAGVAVALTDLDQDGDLDLLLGDLQGPRLFRWGDGRFEDVSRDAGLAGSRPLAPVVGIATGDLDNDERPDVLLLHSRGVSTLRQNAQGQFAPFPRQPSVTMRPGAAALLDADHDGDLDIVLGGQAAAANQSGVVMLRNDGRGTFVDITQTARLTTVGHSTAVVPIDFDNRRDVDLLTIVDARPAILFQNQRDGSFRDVAADVGLGQWANAVSAVTTCDLNKDGFADFAAASASTPVKLALSNGRGRFTTRDGPAGSLGLGALQCADYDNDGLIDLIGAGADGLRVLRNLGVELTDVTLEALDDEARKLRSIDAFSLGDVDGDSDLDLAAASTAGVQFFRNDGQSTRQSVRVGLKGRVSNRSGVGARVDVRAGSLWQRLDRLAISPAVGPEVPSIGLGPHASADTVRVLWPAGILQAETAISGRAVSVVELDRKPSSCPFLYTWNGQSFEFVTDFLGGGEIGYWEAPGRYNHPDPDEFVRVTGEQLRPRGKTLELRVTNELEEVLYLDAVRLLSVDHPPDVEIYPREGMRAAATRGLSAVAVRSVEAPSRVWSDRGEDLTVLVSRRDGRYTDGFVERSIRGYAETHDVIFEMRSPGRTGQKQVLLFTGWTDYAFSSDNVAASQRGWKLDPPRLDVRTGGGPWRALVADVGIPVGRPQTLVVDIGSVAAADSQFRLRTNMRIRWDAIAVADIARDVRLAPQAHSLTRAELAWRGYSAIDDSLTPQPAVPDYRHVLLSSPWKVFAGRYTREGDVRSLLNEPDDLFVVARTGDEVALSFAVVPEPAGLGRTYLVGGVGFSKEMDMNSASPDVVLPLPARGMKRYPSLSTSLKTRARQRSMLEHYNTRVVSRAIPHFAPDR